MSRAFALAAGQPGNPRIVRVLPPSMARTLAMVAALGTAAGWALDAAARAAWRGANRGRRFAPGLAVAAAFMVPLLNLIAPVPGAAMATHLFDRRPA